MPLNPDCTRLNEQLKAAMAAMHHLSDHGCAPREIRLGDHRPVIVIEPPPAGGFIYGGLRRAERVGDARRTVMVASFRNCLLEWEIREPLAPRVSRA